MSVDQLYVVEGWGGLLCRGELHTQPRVALMLGRVAKGGLVAIDALGRGVAGVGGAEGGAGGGTIVATGTPEDVAKIKKSHTGAFLKKML